MNPIVWQIILNIFILTFRPSKTAHAYKKIWRKESNESPLLYYTRSQSLKLKSKIGNSNIIVDFAMRYGNPSIKSRLNIHINLDVKLDIVFKIDAVLNFYIDDDINLDNNSDIDIY